MARTDDSLLAKQAETAQLQGQGAPFDPVEEAIPEPLVSVPVRNESPAQGIARCVALSAANPVLMLLPQDPRRRHAVVLAVDNDVYICPSLELAQSVQGTATGSGGFYLPKGVVMPIVNRAACWVAATTVAAASRVSVLVNKDDE